MKKLNQLIASAAVLACATGSALAQSANFIGPAAGVTVSSQTYKIDRDPVWTRDLTGNGNIFELVGSWGFAMAPQWVGTAGVSLGLSNSDLYADATSRATGKQRASLSFAPGYRLGAGGLVYGKVGYHTMQVNYKDSSGGEITLTHQGFGTGVGYAHALTRNIELRGELETVTYSAENTTATIKVTPKQNNLNVSLLYRF